MVVLADSDLTMAEVEQQAEAEEALAVTAARVEMAVILAPERQHKVLRLLPTVAGLVVEQVHGQALRIYLGMVVVASDCLASEPRGLSLDLSVLVRADLVDRLGLQILVESTAVAMPATLQTTVLQVVRYPTKTILLSCQALSSH